LKLVFLSGSRIVFKSNWDFLNSFHPILGVSRSHNYTITQPAYALDCPDGLIFNI